MAKLTDAIRKRVAVMAVKDLFEVTALVPIEQVYKVRALFEKRKEETNG